MNIQQNSQNVNLEHRFNLDGSANPKYVDLLDEDKPLSGQRFACLSFISPEKILKQRDLFNFEAFLKQWDMNKSLQKYNHFMSFLAYKYGLNFDNLTKDLQDFCAEEKDNLFTYTIEDDYKNFIDLNEQKLDDSFNSTHKFQTSVRGVKVRGCYPNQQEAELRCKLLREVDPNHDVFVGPVGMWMPFHPEAYKTGRVEYLEDELNQLMHEKDKNEKQAKTEFDTRVRETKEKAIADNMKKALESGNVLTQTINEDGQLVSVKDMNTTEISLNENSSLSEIRKELFEGENVVTDFKNSDHGLSTIINK
jgi:vacuolar-type H+-ATPase subunit I/STV1